MTGVPDRRPAKSLTRGRNCVESRRCPDDLAHFGPLPQPKDEVRRQVDGNGASSPVGDRFEFANGTFPPKVTKVAQLVFVDIDV